MFELCSMPIPVGVLDHILECKRACLNLVLLFLVSFRAEMRFLIVVLILAIEGLIIFIKRMLTALSRISVRRREEKLDFLFLILQQRDRDWRGPPGYADAEVHWDFIGLEVGLSLDSVFKSDVDVSFAFNQRFEIILDKFDC